MKTKGQPNWDLNQVPPSQGSNHATNWANEAGSQAEESEPSEWEDLGESRQVEFKEFE